MKKRSGKGYVYFLPDRFLFLFWVIKWLFRLLRIRQQSGYDS